MTQTQCFFSIRKACLFFVLCLTFILAVSVSADPARISASSGLRSGLHQGPPLRRTISPECPLWIIHIDTWNAADPQKIIDMVPDDIRPYVVFNISLSATDATCCDGYAVCDSWLKVCAQNRVWSMVQCASGAHSRFSDFDLTVYEDYFREYPNFLGWNFAEQFWGFGDEGCPSFLDRLSLFTDILKICHNYGGYLVVSFTQAYYSADMNPIAYMKRNPVMNELLTSDPTHFICCEKYTMTNGFYDIESNCLGAYLGGYAGQYGIRFDACGWVSDFDFVKAAGAIPIFEHMQLTGETVIDGPETIPVEVSHEVPTSKTSDGYTRRNWAWFPHFDNINIDGFRKILDGTVRILSRREVIDRTKICIVNDINTGKFDDYLTPKGLYDGLYRADCDHGGTTYENDWLDNKWWLKTSGRYPAIPQVYKLLDDDAKRLTAIRKSQLASRWPNTAAKVEELNALFSSEYTGDIYAAHTDNTWMTYNPYQYEDHTIGSERSYAKATRRAAGNIPLLYNTCISIDLDYAAYSMGLITETSQALTIYLNNYQNSKTSVGGQDVFIEGVSVVDTLRIHGAATEPTFSWNDRSNHRASVVQTAWRDDVYVVTVAHNGPVEINIHCAGSHTDRLEAPAPAVVVLPETPAIYTGTLQYEAEHFDYKNIAACYGNGYYRGHAGYQGQGFIDFGTNTTAVVRDTIVAPRSGKYHLTTRYEAPSTGVPIVIQINTKKYVPTFQKTTGTWAENVRIVELKAGSNVISYRFSTTSVSQIYLDCIRLDYVGDCDAYDFENETATAEATTPAAELVNVRCGAVGVVAYDDAGTTSLGLKSYAIDESTHLGVADLDLFRQDATDYMVDWSAVSGYCGVLLRGIMGAEAGNALRPGYLFIVENDIPALFVISESGDRRVLSPTDLPTVAYRYYRAAVQDSTLSFYASADRMEWQLLIKVVDATYTRGCSQLVWISPGAIVDDLRFRQPELTLSQSDLKDFSSTRGEKSPVCRTFDVKGSSLSADVTLSVLHSDYRIATDEGGVFADTLTLPIDDLGNLAATRIYVRLDSELPIGTYSDTLILATAGGRERRVLLSGNVVPAPYTASYDFESDPVRSAATTPPAIDITLGRGNSCSAGVVSLTDAAGCKSNMLKAYSATSRNGTGVLNLNRFTEQATDYNVTWRQVLGSASSGYKCGVVLRAQPAMVGGTSTGYTPGMMAGYYLCVYNNGTTTEFRIYNSTTGTALTMIQSSSVSLALTDRQSLWYRASVSGTSAVVLKLEYSTDGLHWLTGTSTIDASATFAEGATQFVWGLAASNSNFYIDDLVFDGITYDPSVIDAIAVVDADRSSVVGTDYYNLAGLRVTDPSAAGLGQICIVRRRHADGSVTVSKCVVR